MIAHIPDDYIQQADKINIPGAQGDPRMGLVCNIKAT